MEIMRIWLSQRNLRRAGQIPAMVEAILNGDILPRITLILDEEGEVQVEDGHHRLCAYWLAGRLELEDHEYLLVTKDRWKRRCGKIDGLDCKWLC